MTSKKEAVKQFEQTIAMSELHALSKVSQERPLTESEYNRFMQLKERFIEAS